MAIKLFLPLKEASIFGWQRLIKSIEDLKYIIAKSGQGFGVDKSGPACEFRKDWPCDKTMYQMMGITAHNGIDIPCKIGTPVYASHDGVVVERSDDISAGLGIVLWDKIQNIKTISWHFEKAIVNLGEEVKVGQQIGTADNTGYSKGSHLHFMLKLTNNKGETINKDNGYLGAIDPLPYFDMNKLTKKQVQRLQSLEGFNDPEGVEYWTGKELDQYLVARIPDKIKELTKSLDEQ